MTDLGNLLFSLIYYLTINTYLLWKEIKVMKHFLKGTAAVAIVLIVSMAIHVFCNMKGINLDMPMEAIVSASFAVLIYHVLIKNEKNKE